MARVVPFRALQRHPWLLVSLPMASLLFVLLYTAQDSSSTVVLVDRPRSSLDVREMAPREEWKGGPVESQEMAPPKKPRNFTIHVWKHGERMKRRFLRSYGATERDPFEQCSVSNCRLTTDDARVSEADAVIFHLHQTLGPHTLPQRRSPQQVWIFFTDESPHHTFLATRDYTMRDYDGLFNWSMTYRADSDVPVPYGRTLPRPPKTSPPSPPKKPLGVAILGSNCGGRNHRWDYVRELQRHMAVDVYGGCGTRTCPGHFTRDCPLLADYKFYLAFENSNCREYLTEKLWWNAYAKGAVPVVMGAPKADYERLCPPNSFVHTDDFASPALLAAHLKFLMGNESAFGALHAWRGEFEVRNEHGYFGSPSLHLCRVCEALNAKDTSKPKIYSDLKRFWNAKKDCRRAHWVPS